MINCMQMIAKCGANHVNIICCMFDHGMDQNIIPYECKVINQLYSTSHIIIL